MIFKHLMEIGSHNCVTTELCNYCHDHPPPPKKSYPIICSHTNYLLLQLMINILLKQNYAFQTQPLQNIELFNTTTWTKIVCWYSTFVHFKNIYKFSHKNPNFLSISKTKKNVISRDLWRHSLHRVQSIYKVSQYVTSFQNISTLCKPI